MKACAFVEGGDNPDTADTIGNHLLGCHGGDGLRRPRPGLDLHLEPGLSMHDTRSVGCQQD